MSRATLLGNTLRVAANSVPGRRRLGSVSLTLAVLLGVICAALYETQNHKVVIIGTKDQVIYSGLATKANAMALGNALKSNEYFQDRGVTVLLEKGFGTTTISFGVQDGVWNHPGMLSSFEELAREVAPAVGGLPVQVRLVNSNLEVKEVSTIGEVNFDGPDGIYYEGSATKDEAHALSWATIQIDGLLKGKGANVFLTEARRRHYLSRSSWQSMMGVEQPQDGQWF